MHLKNRGNEYAAALGVMLDECPKAVLAAIAVSALTCGGDYLDEARARVAKEWQTLFDQRIVPQKLGKNAREALSLPITPNNDTGV